MSISYVRAGLDPLASNPPGGMWVTAAVFTSGGAYASGSAHVHFTSASVFGNPHAGVPLHTGQPPGLQDAETTLRTLLHTWMHQRATLRIERFNGGVFQVRNQSRGPLAAIFRVVKT